MTYQEFRSALAKEADDKYRDFVSQGIPTERPILGVHIPAVREIVKTIPLAELPAFINETPVALEEVIARGMMLARLSYDQMLKLFDSQVDYIDDWCSCDNFCSSIRPLARKHLAEFLDLKIDPLLKVEGEFGVRVGLVLLFSYVKADYLSVIFDRVTLVKDREEYYIKMAVAWLLAEAFIKFPDETMGYLLVSGLPEWTFRKTISKICDSRRVEEEAKEELRKLRKREFGRAGE